MKNKITALLLFTVFTFLAQPCLAASSVWKISKADDHFYIGGTIHVLAASDHPMPTEFMQAFNEADTVVFETDMSALEQPAFLAKFNRLMSYQDNRSLKSELSPEVYNKLEKFMTSRGMPIENFQQYQPWAVSLLISVREFSLLGMYPNFGVDSYFHNIARYQKKTIKSLETPDEQLASILSMAEIDQNEGIEYSLRDFQDLPAFAKLMRDSWRSGDIEHYAEHPSIKDMKTDFPEMYKALIIDRNNAWMELLLTLPDNNSTELVLVGFMHLVGEEGLLQQLASRGFTLQQISVAE